MRRNKLPVALMAYVGLALLAWFTLTATVQIGDREVRLGALVVAVMLVFTTRTLLHWWRERKEEQLNAER